MLKFQKKHFFIVKNRAMGDAILGLSAVSYLRSLYPEAQITYAVPEWIAPLFDKLKTDADRIYPLKVKSFNDFHLLWKDLEYLKIDTVFEMHQSGRTGKFFSIYKFFHPFNFNYFFHNHHLKKGTKVLDQGVIKSVIQRDLDGVYSYLNSNDKELPHFLNFPPKLSVKGHMENSEYEEEKIIIGVVATRETKMWGSENYFKLMVMIKNFYKDKNQKSPLMIIPLSKSVADEKIKIELLQYATKAGCLDLFKIEQVDLSQLALVVDKAKLYIGNDTGLKHLAVSLGVKTYTFFGPEPPNEWHPYDVVTHEYFYKDGLDCRTKTAHYCGLSTCLSMICLNQFEVKDVFLKIVKDL